MKLHNYETGDFIRVATLDEYKLSVAASKIDGGAGVITVDGVRCYVEGEPETGLSWNDIQSLPEMTGHRLPTVEEVLAIPNRIYPEWTAGRTYFGQHWADSSISVYVAKVVYPDGRIDTHRTSQRNGGIAFQLIKEAR